MSPLGAAWRKTVRASSWAVGVDSDDGWVDVWSRAGRKHRTRAGILLGLDMLLFVGLCLFTYWLRTGYYLPFHGSEYGPLLLNSFKVSGPDQVSLANMLVSPISVERTPMQMVILALAVAALVSVPILVSILYRFPFALPFAAMISVVAVMPWMGITAVLACAVASLRPLRMHFRFASALLGLVPFAVYLWMSLRSGGEQLPVAGGVELFKMYAPWVLSMMAACFNLAVVLSLASLVGYRPGVIAPVLAILFAVPVVLFETRVGQDELYYSKLEASYGPASPSCFRSGGVVQFLMEDEADEARELYWRVYAPVGESLESVRDLWRANLPTVQPLKQKVEQLAIQDLEDDRGRTVDQVERFIADFPNSPRVPAALYLEGRALDTQLDLMQLRRDGVFVYHDDFPSMASFPVWQAMAGSYEDHPLAAVARYKLAIHALRTEDPAEALVLLTRIQTQAELRRIRPATPTEGWFSLLMTGLPATDTLDVDVEEVALQARQMSELIEANAKDSRYGAAPLAVLFRMDPHDQRYRDNLLWMAEAYPDALLYDNVQLLIALTNPSLSVRISYLERHLSVYDGQDSIPRALYELGRVLEADSRYGEAIDRYDAVVKRYPQSVWGDMARQSAAKLKLSLGK